jgi:hypothetical protein
MLCPSQSLPAIHHHDLSERDGFMISKIEVYNFRCFKSLELEGLKRVNLITGQNSSGKSAFLEAIFISSGSLAPSTIFQMRAIRRMGGQVAAPNDAMTYRGLWQDAFFDFNENKKVTIRMTGNPASDGRSLKFEYIAPVSNPELPFEKLSLPDGGSRAPQAGMPQIEFKWKRDGHPEITAKPRFLATGMQIETASVDLFPCVWFTPGVLETPDENAKRFSELDKKGELAPILEALAKEFPFIEGLSLDYHAGYPMVFAKLAGQNRKLPVPLVSDGVNRLLGICLGLAIFRGGIVLIDQIEDGFHHKLLPSIWKSIYSLAKKFNVQLFVSSHSRECIGAMMGILRDHESDFTLLRATRKDLGSTITVLDGKYLEAALEQDFEVR